MLTCLRVVGDRMEHYGFGAESGESGQPRAECAPSIETMGQQSQEHRHHLLGG
jgi:hypothetical protein